MDFIARTESISMEMILWGVISALSCLITLPWADTSISETEVGGWVVPAL